MDTIAKRFKYARECRNMSQEEVADCVGCGQSTIVKIESGETKKSRYLYQISKCLEVPIHWLEDGLGTIDSFDLKAEESNVVYSIAKDYKGLVPVISWVQAGETHVAFIENIDQYTRKVKTKKKVSKNAYALEVRGSSMTAPEGSKFSFPEGYIIIVDPDQRGDTTDGVFIIAKEEGADAVTFKQLKYDGSTPYLNPLNPAYPKIFKPFRIVGKVVDWDANLPELP